MELLPVRYRLINLLTELERTFETTIEQKNKINELQEDLIKLVPSQKNTIISDMNRFNSYLNIPYTEDIQVAIIKNQSIITQLKTQYFIRFINNLQNDFIGNRIKELEQYREFNEILTEYNSKISIQINNLPS